MKKSMMLGLTVVLALILTLGTLYAQPPAGSGTTDQNTVRGQQGYYDPGEQSGRYAPRGGGDRDTGRWGRDPAHRMPHRGSDMGPGMPGPGVRGGSRGSRCQ
jgi:hypothetical protein